MRLVMRRFQIFISSPADVEAERDLAISVIARLDDRWKDHIRLDPYDWRAKSFEAQRDFQQAIAEMHHFDVVVGILWKRMGSELAPERHKRADGTAYESGTAFEIETGLASGKANKKPAVYVFKCTRAIKYDAETYLEDHRQHEILNAWWNRTFKDDEGHFARGHKTFREAEDFEAMLESTLTDFLKEGGFIPDGPSWNIDQKGSPYPGLYHYDSHYGSVFFGRSLAVAAALKHFKAVAQRALPALFIIGASGSGKSSLARAGLLPRFSGGQIEGVDFWRTIIVDPDPDPLAAFANKLYQPGGLPELKTSQQADAKTFAERAGRDPKAGLDAISWSMTHAAAALSIGHPRVGRMLILVDQLEVILEAGKHRPLMALVRVLVEAKLAWLVTTLRSDRYAPLLLDENLMALKRNGAQFDLPPPGPSEISEIIEAPAREAGLEFEEPQQPAPPVQSDGGESIGAAAHEGNLQEDHLQENQLQEAILKDADLEHDHAPHKSLAERIRKDVKGSDALPLLQMTLSRLFDARDARRLTFEAYKNMGGLAGAIAAHANDVFNSVSKEAQEALDDLLQALVKDFEDDTFTIATPKFADITKTDAERELVTTFIERRLLVNADGSVRVAHEALLRRWELAKQSSSLDPDAIRLRRQIEPRFQEWRVSQSDADLLQPGTSLLGGAEAVLAKNAKAFREELRAYVWHSVAVASERAEVEIKQQRQRTLIARVIAAAFAGIALAALCIYIQAQTNLGFARLTRAEESLVKERPAAALALAAKATDYGPLAALQQLFSSFAGTRDDSTLVKTIFKIAQPASQAPIFSARLGDPAKPVGGQSVAFSPDGSQFAVADTDGKVTLFRTKDRVVRAVLRGDKDGDMVESVQFSPDGKWLASASDDKTIRLWDLATFASRQLGAGDGHASKVVALAFHPKLPLLASASNDGHVMVWDINRFEKLRDFPAQKNASGAVSWVLSVAFSHDGNLLAASDDDGRILIRHVGDWQPVRMIATQRTDLNGIDFSPDDRIIASASILGALDLWSVATGEKQASLADYQDKLWKVHFSPDGKLIAAASWDGSVRFWDAKTLHYAGTLDGNDLWVTDVAFSADPAGKLPPLALTADRSGAVRLWRLDHLHPMFMTFRDSARETLTGTYSADRALFATGARDGYMRLYRVLDDGDLAFICQAPHEDWVSAIAFSPSSDRIYSAGNSDGQQHNLLKVWKTAAAPAQSTGGSSTRQGLPECMALPPIDVGSDVIDALGVSADDKTLAWATLAGQVWLKDVANNGVPRQLPYDGHGAIRALDFSADGRWLAVGGDDQDRDIKRVMLWDLASNSSAALAAHHTPIWQLKFSPDSNWLASDGDDGIFIWHPSPGSAPAAHLQARSTPNGNVVFNAAGAYFAYGTEHREFYLWSVGDWKKQYELDGLVGVRGVYGFDRNDNLAFDGENGLVRILPKSTTAPSPEESAAGEVEGVDVFFDTKLPSIPAVAPLVCVVATCPPPSPPR
jgi:WD40 repeat protein